MVRARRRRPGMQMFVSRIERKESLESSRRAGTASSVMSGLKAMQSWAKERLRGMRRKILFWQSQKATARGGMTTYASFEMVVLFSSKVESLGRRLM
jgi:hypothetical protein